MTLINRFLKFPRNSIISFLLLSVHLCSSLCYRMQQWSQYNCLNPLYNMLYNMKSRVWSKHMLFEFVVSIFVRVSANFFKWFDQNILVYIFTTVKSFEYVIVFCCAVLFLLITVNITLRQARKLPSTSIPYYNNIMLHYDIWMVESNS